MKLRIKVKARGVVVDALVDTKHESLSRSETEAVATALADRLHAAITDLPYIPTPRSAVLVFRGDSRRAT